MQKAVTMYKNVTSNPHVYKNRELSHIYPVLSGRFLIACYLKVYVTPAGKKQPPHVHKFLKEVVYLAILIIS
jgi:hypothetical protein